MRFALATILLALGLLVGCSVEFDAGEDDVFPCDDDSDCIGNNQCIGGYCNPPTSGGNDAGGDTDNGPIAECNPEDIAGYPTDHLDDPQYPLDVQEVCDGQDNNCDGHVDIIFCESDSDCPSDQSDPNGVGLSLRCNTELAEPVCEAFAPIEFGPGCGDPVECVDGEYETVHPDCGGVIGNGDNDNGNGEDDNGNGEDDD